MLSSSQNFVRALKGSSDPLTPGGPSKLELARTAWDQKAFYAPRKAEVIADLILNRFSKNSADSITELQAWRLLLDVVSSPGSNSWLAPFITRASFTRIIIFFLQSYINVDTDTQSQLSPVVQSCFTIIWPLCIAKSSTEALLECFGAFLGLLKRHEPDQHIAHITVTVSGSLLRSLSTATTRKKMFSAFIQNYIGDWLSSLKRLSNSQNAELFDSVYNSGAECLLNLDVLRDSKTEVALFGALDMAHEDVLPILPQLFLSYVQALRKNRGALFGQGSSQKLDSLEEFREAGLRFFASCQPILDKAASQSEAWRTKSFLLDVINQENMFISSERHLSTERLFGGIVRSTLVELASDHEDVIGPAVLCLSSLARIEYRLIEAVLPDIVAQLLLIPDTVSPALELLELILRYHIKTRTVNTYIGTLMSISSSSEAILKHGVEKMYSRMSRSACLHPVHLDRLGKCAQDFLPLNQTVDAVRIVTERIRNLWAELRSSARSEDDRSPPKRRKIDTGNGTADINPTALTLFASASFAGAVLSSFSAESVPEEAQKDLELLVESFSSEVILQSLSKTFKSASRKGEHLSWARELILLAMLRLRYAVSLQRSPNISIHVECSEKLSQRMVESVTVVDAPELKLEILRTLFKISEEGQTLTVLDVALDLLQSSGISDGFSILHMIIQRWLPAVDVLASKTQLDRLILMFSDLQTSNGVLWTQALTSAEFWELPNIRATLLAFIDRATSVTDNWQNASDADRERTFSVFNMLLFAPVEYLTRPLRTTLVKRAFMLDKMAASVPHHDSALRPTLPNLHRCIAHLLSLADYSEYLLGDINLYLQHLHAEGPSAALDWAPETIELIQILLRALLRAGHSEETSNLLQCYSDNLQATSFIAVNPWARTFSVLVDLLVKDQTLKSLSPTTQAVFKSLCEALHERISLSVAGVIDSRSAPKIVEAKGLLQGWLDVLRLSRWSGPPSMSSTVLISSESMVQLFAFAAHHNSHKDISILVFCILLEEFSLCDMDSRIRRLEIVIAAYVLLCKSRPTGGLDYVDRSISSACSVMTPEHFKHALDLIADSLKDATGDEVNHLVHLGTVLLQDSPSSTFQIVQSFMTEAINTFNNRVIFVQQARLTALRLISQRCRDRPATLRLLDISGIWSFLAKICVGAEVHDSNTSTETFHCIVSITTALIRLRRDLVLLTIPHLGVILRRLVLSMQSSRPNLGTKQAVIVSRGLPSWINVQEPLGVEESRALSRLLESLTTKTVVRKLNPSSTAAAPKAESLAKPFSKHAAYILKTYVESLNDPLCVLPAGVRKELQPGLYALCGMLNEFSRDALMASVTDAGEKTVLKTLWREYEKQRYIGKG